ncbi:MAG: hypothetical protein II830_04020, partial [Alphaproteobacteria bacterium]|nr:hypothetical protein [Alphaproteobacteria bacterium]
MKEKKNLFTEQQQNVSVCMFDLGNGQFADKVLGNQKFRSLIVDVDEHRGIALGICPTLMMLPWSYAPFEINTSNVVSGREATAELLQQAAKQGVELGAAAFCANYEGFGVKCGEAFLPSRFELSILVARERSLKAALARIGFNKCSYTFWSSSVGMDSQVWMQSLSSYSVSDWKSQLQTFGVMPMIEIV